MRILFTGLGSIGTRHLRLLREREEDHEILAYRSGEGEGDADVEGVTEYHDLGEALDGDPDVAFVTNPTHLHVETATACAERGCDLFVEKPLSNSMDGIDRLLDLVEERDLVTLMGCHLRFNPVLRTVREELESGSIGEVRSYRAYSGSYLPDWRPDRDYRETYSARREMGGGVALDLIHEIDYAYWLFGDLRRVRSIPARVSDLEIETEDHLELIGDTSAGVVGNLHLDYHRPVPRRTLEVIGSDAVLTADLLEGTLERRTPEDATTFAFEFERDDMYRDQLEYFLEHVREGKPCENDLAEGAAVLEIALAAREEFYADG